MNITGCGSHHCWSMDLGHRKGDVCYRVGREVRNSTEIKKYLWSTYSVSGIKTAPEVAVVSPGSCNGSVRDGTREAMGS